MNSRTKTEDMPALQQPGAGYRIAREAQERHAHPPRDFDDEPTVPGFRHNQIKEG